MTQLKNGEWLAANYSLAEDDPLNPRLRLLREREKLDEIVAPGKTQLEKIILLRHWAHSQWNYTGGPFYYPPWDAVEILDLARKIGNKGFCAQYSIVFLQACRAMGLHARYIDLPEHFVVGVWSDEINRWIVMDPSNDVHYEKFGQPVTGRELCNAYWEKNLHGLTKVSGDGSRIPANMDDVNFYRMYSIVAKADQLKNPVTVHVNSNELLRLVRLDDYHHYPMIGRDVIGFSSSYVAWKQPGAKEQFKDMLLSEDRDDFSYRMNQTILFVVRKDPVRGLAKLILWPESSPTFKAFEVDLDDGTGWRPMVSKDVFWPLQPGENVMHVRIRTEYGWTGKPAECRIYFKPAWWGILPPSTPELPSASKA